MKKSVKINLIVWSSLLLILVSAAMIYYLGDSYKEFYTLAEKDFAIPGLETKFVPQGLEYVASTEEFLVSGYMSNNQPSRIYIVDPTNTNKTKYVTLKDNDKELLGHFGGIAVNGNDCFIASDKMVYRFNFTDITNTPNGKSIIIEDSFKPGNGADFILTYNNQLIVGEFYLEKKYETNELHHITVTNNQKNYALAYIYNLDCTKEFGLETTIPVAALSLPKKVQGMNITTNGDIILSTSYSLPNSKLLVYKNVFNEATDTSLTIKDANVPVYILDESSLIKSISAPAMSEELVLVNDKIYLLFESNCAKYRLFNRERISHVYKLDI